MPRTLFQLKKLSAGLVPLEDCRCKYSHTSIVASEEGLAFAVVVTAPSRLLIVLLILFCSDKGICGQL